MRKFLFFLVIAFFTVSIANAQFKVMLVDDDNYDGSTNPPSSEASPITDALTNWGGVYSYWYINDQGIPAYSDLQTYDMVIWFTGNSGANLGLWDVADTLGIGSGAAKFNAGLSQYVNAGGVLWIDGLDFLYDLYGGAPDDFAAGDFVYDKLGITQYLSQSKSDDGGTGVSQMDKSSSNSVTTVDPIAWTYSTMWYADGMAINSNAVALYQMGPSGYALEGQTTAFYYNNIIVSSIRLSKVDPQTDLDQLISEMITAAQSGTFVASNVDKVSENNINIYPNPVTETATINLSEINTASELMIFDNMGRKVYSQALNANQENVTINVSDLASGLYHVNITSNNSIYSTKFSVVK